MLGWYRDFVIDRCTTGHAPDACEGNTVLRTKTGSSRKTKWKHDNNVVDYRLDIVANILLQQYCYAVKTNEITSTGGEGGSLKFSGVHALSQPVCDDRYRVVR